MTTLYSVTTEGESWTRLSEEVIFEVNIYNERVTHEDIWGNDILGRGNSRVNILWQAHSWCILGLAKIPMGLKYTKPEEMLYMGWQRRPQQDQAGL